MVEALPGFELELVGLEVVLDEVRDEGSAEEAASWIVSRSRGRGNGVMKEGVGCMRWRRTTEGWRASAHYHMRGPGTMGM